MSEDRPDADADKAASGDTASEAPVPTAETAPDTRRSTSRLVILGGLLVVTLVGAFVVHRARTTTHQGDAIIGSGSNGAAIRAFATDDPTGVRLTGMVVDGAGAPVAGAEVTAEIEKGVDDKALAPTPRVPTSSQGSAVGSAGSGSGRAGSGSGSAGSGSGSAGSGSAAQVFVAAPTGLDGRFVIGGLSPGRFKLRVTGPGLLPAELRYVPVPSDATRIVVARQVAIEGIVLDGGKPAINVTVGLRGDPIGGGIENKSDLAGKFAFPDLPEGRYQLFAWQGSLAARAVRVNRMGTGPFTPLELHLEPAAIVIGRVIDKDEGTGIVAAIELRPSGDDQAPRYVRSGDDGVFRIEGVPNGRWIADAYAPGFTSPGGVEMEAGKGIPELALVRGATIEGRVVDSDGNPIDGASVRAMSGGANPIETSELVEQDMLRRFSGILLSEAPAAGASAADPQFVPRGELGVLLGPIPPLPPPGVAIARPATLDPTTASLAAEPALLPGDPARASIWLTGADGRFRIRGLPKGKHAILAVAPGFAEGRSKQAAVEGSQVLTGIDVVLTPGTFIIGKVTDQHRVPVVGAQITAKPEAGTAIDAFTDGAGEYRLGPISGKLELHAVSFGHGEVIRTVELVPANGRTAGEQREDFTLVVADAVLAGTLDDANGTAVAGAQLEVVGGPADGRRVVAGSDGTFSLDMLPAGILRVRIRHPDYPVTEVEAMASSGGARVRLRIPLGGAVEGAVIEAASGTPVAGITITADGPNKAAAEAATDKLGRWRLGPLEPGTWKLTVKHPGFLPLSRDVSVTAARTPGTVSVRDVRLELARGALVGGTVRDARGQRVVGATIVVRAVAGGASAEAVSNNLGEFRVRDAPTGDVVIIATKDAHTGATRATVRPGDEILSLSIDVR